MTPWTQPGGRGWNLKAVLREGLVVGCLGLVFALTANKLSPHGLSLTENYFPAGIAPVVPSGKSGRDHGTNLTGAETVVATLKTNEAPLATSNPAAAVVAAAPVVPRGSDDSTNIAEENVLVRLKAVGLQLASSNQVAAWFADPRRQTQQVVFVDARDEDDFKGGHIPGAWLFNHFEQYKYVATVVPVCQTAEVVVVYCDGGECDDSLSAAVILRDYGIPNPKLYVYAGGMPEWLASGRPVETGPRDSGQYLKTTP